MSSAPVTQPAIGYPPSFNRRLHLIVVECCVFCGTSHVHRTGSLGGVRRAGCGKGHYDVRPRAPRRRTMRAVA